MEKSLEKIQHIDRIRSFVSKKLEEYKDQLGISLNIIHLNSEESRSHIIETGTSILCAKWDIGYPPGGFVKSVVDNDLMGSFGNADHINQEAIKFYVLLLYNSSYVY